MEVSVTTWPSAPLYGHYSIGSGPNLWSYVLPSHTRGSSFSKLDRVSPSFSLLQVLPTWGDGWLPAQSRTLPLKRVPVAGPHAQMVQLQFYCSCLSLPLADLCVGRPLLCGNGPIFESFKVSGPRLLFLTVILQRDVKHVGCAVQLSSTIHSSGACPDFFSHILIFPHIVQHTAHSMNRKYLPVSQ